MTGSCSQSECSSWTESQWEGSYWIIWPRHFAIHSFIQIQDPSKTQDSSCSSQAQSKGGFGVAWQFFCCDYFLFICPFSLSHVLLLGSDRCGWEDAVSFCLFSFLSLCLMVLNFLLLLLLLVVLKTGSTQCMPHVLSWFDNWLLPFRWRSQYICRASLFRL